MAKQSSFIKLEGSIGDVTFYKDRTGQYNARTKGGVSKARIMTDKQFQRTRENLAEFSRAAAASKMLKDAFREITLRAKDVRTNNRIYARTVQVLKTDPFNIRGERTVEEGDVGLFTGFQFNFNVMLESVLYSRYSIASGPAEVEVSFAPFVPEKHMAFPVGATHGRIFLASAAVDFPQGTFDADISYSPAIELNAVPVEDLSLSLAVPSVGEEYRFYALGVEFLQSGNQELLYDLNNKAHNAARIILVEPGS